jgi:hypothetical protein
MVGGGDPATPWLSGWLMLANGQQNIIVSRRQAHLEGEIPIAPPALAP